jgi:hypothetical protein
MADARGDGYYRMAFVECCGCSVMHYGAWDLVLTTQMKVAAQREHLLEALQSVIGVVERRQTMPILSNVLRPRQRSYR